MSSSTLLKNKHHFHVLPPSHPADFKKDRKQLPKDFCWLCLHMPSPCRLEERWKGRSTSFGSSSWKRRVSSFPFTECSSWLEPQAPETVSCFISGGVFLCLWCGLLLHSGCSPRFYTEVHAATLNCVDSLEDKERRWLDFCSRSHVAWFFTLKKPNTFF